MQKKRWVQGSITSWQLMTIVISTAYIGTVINLLNAPSPPTKYTRLWQIGCLDDGIAVNNSVTARRESMYRNMITPFAKQLGKK